MLRHAFKYILDLLSIPRKVIINIMLKNFLMKKMLKHQLKDVPQDQQDKLIGMIEKNPQLFQQIATEAQAKMKEGKDQMTAMMEVMQNHQEELKKIM